MNDTGVNNLLVAIAQRAVIDLRSAYLDLWKSYLPGIGASRSKKQIRRGEEDEKLINDCERFFRGKWYQELFDFGGERIIEICYQQADKEYEKALETGRRKGKW